MTSRLRCATTGLVLVLLVRAPAPCADTAGRVVRYADDALTVRLVNVPLSEVLDELSRQTGAEIQGRMVDVREVSADFEAVPLPEALHRLLGNQNFALIYGDKGLKAVKLLGEARVSNATVTTAWSAPGTTIPAPPQETLSSFLALSVPLPPGSPLTHLLENPTTVRELVEVGLGNEDASVRADAVRTALRAMETRPELRAAVADEVSGMDDVSLSGLLRGTAGAHAEEIASLVSTEARIPQLRAKAKSVLRTIRGGQ